MKEGTRDGFISVEDEEAEKKLTFYPFIDKKIDEEHFGKSRQRLFLQIRDRRQAQS